MTTILDNENTKVNLKNQSDVLVITEWNILRKLMWSQNCIISPMRFINHLREVAIQKNKEEVVEKTKVEVMNLLKQTIRPEFLNRIDEVIMFQPLMKSDIKNIITIQLNDLKRLVKQNDIQLEFSDYALDYLAENGFDPQFGARPLKRLIQKQIVNQLSKRIIQGDIDKSLPVIVDVFDGLVVFRNEAQNVPGNV